MLRFELSGEQWLRLLEESDAEELYAVVEANRDYLARWMPWATGQTLEDTSALLGVRANSSRVTMGFKQQSYRMIILSE